MYAMSNPLSLLMDCIAREIEMIKKELELEHYSPEERREQQVYRDLLRMVPGLEERLMQDGELEVIVDFLRKGLAVARGNDTKGLKGAVVDWITPNGQVLDPPLTRNTKINCGFHHNATGALLCPTWLDWDDPETKMRLKSGEIPTDGNTWPKFLYEDNKHEKGCSWKGLFQSQLLVNAYRFVFTSPSSVEKDDFKATHSGNARIHSMTHVNAPSLAYIPTQLHFALTSATVFAHTDKVTDSERFYHSMLDLLEDPAEQKEVTDLLCWWDQQIFLQYSRTLRDIHPESVTAQIRLERAAANIMALNPSMD